MPPISISLLAKELNVPQERILPLIQHGYLKCIDETTVEAPSKEGLLWLRQWFQPAQAKPLFSARDIAELLKISEQSVPSVLAAHDIPAIHDPALGLCVSTFGARRLLMECMSTGTRFDRIALIHFLLNGDNPCPPFNEALEKEVERINKLPEPTRSIRKDAILGAWKDATALVGAEAPDTTAKILRRL